MPPQVTEKHTPCFARGHDVVYMHVYVLSACIVLYSPKDVDRLAPVAAVVQPAVASATVQPPSPLPSWCMAASAGVSSSGVDERLSGDSYAVVAATTTAATSGIYTHRHTYIYIHITITSLRCTGQRCNQQGEGGSPRV